MGNATKINIGTGSRGVGQTALQLLTSITFRPATDGQTVVEARNWIAENVDSPCYVQAIRLVNGDNTITIPPAAGAVLFVPSPYATGVAILKSIASAADNEGFSLSKIGPNLISWPVAPPANFVLKWGGTGHNQAAVTLVAASDQVTLTTHGLALNDVIFFESIPGTSLPPELQFDTPYYVQNVVDANNVKIAATPSAAAPIDITAAGTSVKLTSACEFTFVWI